MLLCLQILGYRYTFIVNELFSKFFWVIPWKRKDETITDEMPKNLSTSKRKHIKLAKDFGKEFYNSFVQNFLKVKKTLKKPELEKGNADWLSELSSVIKQNKILKD